MTARTPRSLIAATALMTALALPHGFAAASSELDGIRLGTSADEIRANLAAQGYEVRKVKPEDGMLEAYALKDGKLLEIYVDPASGNVAKVKADD